MSGEEFVTLAGSLVANTSAANAEPRFRTAASRSYYGAFHVAAETLAILGRQVKRNHTGHRETIDTLRGLSVTEAHDAGSIIDDLHAMRIKADYRMDDARFRNPDNAKLLVEDALAALSSLKRCVEDAEIKAKLIEELKVK